MGQPKKSVKKFTPMELINFRTPTQLKYLKISVMIHFVIFKSINWSIIPRSLIQKNNTTLTELANISNPQRYLNSKVENKIFLTTFELANSSKP